VFENRILTEIFRPKRDEVKEDEMERRVSRIMVEKTVWNIGRRARREKTHFQDEDTSGRKILDWKLGEIAWNGNDRIKLIRCRDRWSSLLATVICLWFHKICM
jgi:hypothetical protein